MASGSSPRAPRTSVMLSARLYGAGLDDGAPLRVVNLSETGICLAANARLGVGDDVSVSIGEIDYAPAQVMWSRDGLAGLRFHRPIDVAAARRRRPGAATATPAAIGAGWFASRQDAYRIR